jgi:hypothetical protein
LIAEEIAEAGNYSGVDPGADSAEAVAANKSRRIYFKLIRRVQYNCTDDNDESKIYIHPEIERWHSDLEFDGMVAQCCTTRPRKRVQRCQRLPEEATRCPDVK